MKEYNPLSTKDMQRLLQAKKAARKAQEQRRSKRREFIEDFVGHHWGPDGTGRDDRTPLNLRELAISIYSWSLVAQMPQVMVESVFPEMRAIAADLQADANTKYRDIQLAEVLEEIVLDAMFDRGIAKVAVNEYDGAYDIGEETIYTARATIARVSLDHFVYDHTANAFRDVSFSGDRYEIDWDDLNNDEEANKKVVNTLTPTVRPGRDEVGAEAFEPIEYEMQERTDEKYREVIEAWDIWLPRNKLVLTMSDQQPTPIKITDWTGHKKGPYFTLGFQKVPDAITPLSPSDLLKDLDDLQNKLYNKAAEDALEQKDVLGYSGEAADDAERIVGAKNREAIRMDNPGKVAEYKFNGADPRTVAASIQAKNDFDFMAGGLSILGGMGPSSETAAQDKLLSQQASKRLEFMRQRVESFTQEVLTALMHFDYTDPLLDRHFERKVAGTQITVPARLTAERIGNVDMNFLFKITPHSMQYESPQARNAKMWQMLDRVSANPMFAQAGIMPNLEYIMRQTAQLLPLHDLDEMFIFRSAAETPGPDTSRGPASPPQTHRTYERVNRPGATQQGHDQTMQALLSGAGVQDANAGAVGRMIS